MKEEGKQQQRDKWIKRKQDYQSKALDYLKDEILSCKKVQDCIEKKKSEMKESDFNEMIN